MSITRIFDILDLYKTTYKKTDMLSAKENKQWRTYSSDECLDRINRVSYAMLAMGLQRGDKVAIIAANSPEWTITDYACQQAGLVSVPIYPTISANDMKFVLNHAEAKAIFMAGKSIYARIASMESELPLVQHVVSFDRIEGLMHFSDVLALGERNPAPEKIEAIKQSIRPDDLLTILYTSGTSGIPKGVMLSHHNILQNVISCEHFAPFASWWRALSFLPLNHVYERMLNTLYLYKGISIYFAEGIETVGDNLKEISPQIFVTVPRLLERVYERIEAAGEKLEGTKRRLFDWSIRLAEQYEPDGKNGAWYELKRKIADKLVYSKWRDAVGGKLVCMACGGAALNPRLERLFLCAKIVVLQGYGLTETSPVIAVNQFGKGNLKIGTVGPVIDSMQVKIAEADGEILAKGPCIMMGYFKNPEATAEAIDAEGWFHTGDVGTFVEGRFLKITDRKKEIFKTSGGKYIAPLAIENKIKESRFVEQCMVVGEGEKFASALIVPNMANFREYCKANSIEWTGNEEMYKSPELKKLIDAHIKQMNNSLAPYEQIKRPEILDSEWSVDGGELTPKLSLKRKVIKEKYAAAIARIFEGV